MDTVPSKVDIFQFIPVFRTIGACAKDAPNWFLQAECDGRVRVWSDDEEPYYMVETPLGRVRADPYDWIILVPSGSLYVLDDETLDLTEGKFSHRN
jgi:hypothetical protein